MPGFERDIKLLEEYKQWQVINKHKPDTSPTAFMVDKAQQEAYEKLEKLEEWVDKYYPQEMSTEAREAFNAIMEGRY